MRHYPSLYCCAYHVTDCSQFVFLHGIHVGGPSLRLHRLVASHVQCHMIPLLPQLARLFASLNHAIRATTIFLMLATVESVILRAHTCTCTYCVQHRRNVTITALCVCDFLLPAGGAHSVDAILYLCPTLCSLLSFVCRLMGALTSAVSPTSLLTRQQLRA